MVSLAKVASTVVRYSHDIGRMIGIYHQKYHNPHIFVVCKGFTSLKTKNTFSYSKFDFGLAIDFFLVVITLTVGHLSSTFRILCTTGRHIPFEYNYFPRNHLFFQTLPSARHCLFGKIYISSSKWIASDDFSVLKY